METLLDRRHYTRLNTGAGGQGALADAADVLSRNGWVEGVVGVMQQLIATNVSHDTNDSVLHLFIPPVHQHALVTSRDRMPEGNYLSYI